MLHIVLLLSCAVLIYLACEWFINAVEWLGVAMTVGPVAVGTILAAVGTALPESVVTLVAVTPGFVEDAKDIGVGTAMLRPPGRSPHRPWPRSDASSPHRMCSSVSWSGPGPALGLPAAVVALLLSPVATELPEMMNVVIWVRQGKSRLALANVSGAMMIQATVPSGLGLLFTAWKFDAPLLASGIATMVAIVFLLVTTRAGRLTPGRLAWTAAAYLAFAATLPVLM